MSQRTALIALIGLFSLNLLSAHPAFSDNPKSSASINLEKAATPRKEIGDTKPFLSLKQAWLLVIAIFSALSVFVFNQLSAFFERRRDRIKRAEALKERAEALMVALGGEVSSIRALLRGTVKPSLEMFEQGQPLKVETRLFPMTIFKANADRLGEIRNVNLVRHLSNLYSLLDQTNDFAKRYKDWTSPSGPFFQYFSVLIDSFDLSVLLDLELRKETEHLIIIDREFTLSPDDADDRNFCIRARQLLAEARKAHENRQ